MSHLRTLTHMHRAPNSLLLSRLQIRGRDHHIFDETSSMKDGNQEKTEESPLEIKETTQIKKKIFK